jgi:Family of unknown function (DUF5684)
MFVQATDYGNNGMSGGAFFLWFVIIYVLLVIPYYGIFTKAGRPAWAAFIPIYSTIVLLEVVGRPVWWIILFFVPIVNIVILSWIFLMILAFGSSTYRGPIASPGAMAPPPPPPPAMPPA